ncbi:MAG: HAMP domain-containing sensor histidine kinase [Herpetosiphon sp.]
MSRTWARIGLRDQLALVVALVIIALLTAFSSFLYGGLRQFLLNQHRQRLQTAGITAMTVVMGQAPAPPHRNVPVTLSEPVLGRLREVVESVTDSRTSVVVFNPGGDVIMRGQTIGHASQPDMSRLPPTPPQAEPADVKRAIRTDKPVSFRRRADKVPQMAVLIPVYNKAGQPAAVLQIASSIQSTNELLRRLIIYLVVGTLITVLLGMAVAVALTTQVLQPLKSVVRASAAVAGGDFNTRVRLPPGNELGQLGAAFDEMVERTAESFGRQQRFVADAAHELRTPLTAIGGSIEMLQIGAVDHEPEKRRRLLHSLGNEVERLGRLVNDLLLLSHLDQGPPSRWVEVDIRPLLLDLIDQTHLVAPEHTVVADLPCPLLVCGNADHLRQVFVNLLSNARTYTPAGGTITVAARGGANLRVEITDTGIGIPADDLPRIWDRLYRVDRSRSRAGGGFGLGLAIVQSIVTAHHGSVEVSSTPGTGTSFVVFLPTLHTA